jgi:hypothetical protein
MLPLALSLIKFAPSAIKLLAGDKAGAAADKIVNIAEAITGKKGDDAVQAINSSPELALAFQQSVMDYEIESQKLNAEDRKNAREYAKDDDSKAVNKLTVFTCAMVLIVIVGAGYMFSQGTFDKMDALQASIATLILREAFAKYEQVCNFFFGSSLGSKQKDKK